MTMMTIMIRILMSFGFSCKGFCVCVRACMCVCAFVREVRVTDTPTGIGVGGCCSDGSIDSPPSLPSPPLDDAGEEAAAAGVVCSGTARFMSLTVKPTEGVYPLRIIRWRPPWGLI